MCFSNLPVEFDEDGNPYLAEEADSVEHPDGCGAVADRDLSADPERAYEEILESVRDDTVRHIDDHPTPQSEPERVGGE